MSYQIQNIKRVRNYKKNNKTEILELKNPMNEMKNPLEELNSIFDQVKKSTKLKTG